MAIKAGKYCVDPLNMSEDGSVWVALPGNIIKIILTVITVNKKTYATYT